MLQYPVRFSLDNLRRGFNIPSAPFLVNYSVTLRCNLGCKYCGVSGLVNNYAQEELSALEISRFLEDKMLQRIKVVVITGGEPFLKEDLEEIIWEFKKKVNPAIFHITTNGFLTQRIVDAFVFLKSKGVKLDLKVSIDDLGPKHDALRGKEGSFRNALNTIQKLRSIFDRKDVFIGLNQTIYEDNYRSIPEVRRLSQELGIAYFGFIGLKKRALYSDGADNDHGLLDLSLLAGEFIEEELRKGVFPKIGRDNFSETIEQIMIRHYTNGQIKLLHQKKLKHRCMNLFSHFRLNPNGDILTCSYDIEPLGNIKLEKYSKIMSKPNTKNKLFKVKGCGKCWLGCETTPSRAASLFLA